MRSQQGAASHFALVTAAPLLIISGTVLSQVTTHQKEQEVLQGETSAQSLAVSGAHDVLARLAGDPGFRGGYERELAGGRAWIEVTDWSNDGIDNDDDGVVDGDSEADRLGVVSTGWVNTTLDEAGAPLDMGGRRHRAVTELVLQRNDVDLAFEQAVYVDNPFSELDLNGNAFLVSGADTELDGTAGSEGDRPALGTPGDPSMLIAQVSGQQADNIQGTGGSPSIMQVSEEDLVALADHFASMATVRWNDAQASFSGSLGDSATMSDMVIAHATGDLDLHGTTSGAGILVVDGDLTIRGDFDYAGVILTRGSITFRGGGGGKNVHGALLCLGSVETSEIEISGSVEVHYSSTALETVSTQIAGYSVMAWTDR